MLLKKATASYHEGSVWTYTGNYDIALPCATQNEINGEAAKRLVAQGVICVSEGANMPSDLDAIAVYKEKWYLLRTCQSCQRWWCSRFSPCK